MFPFQKTALALCTLILGSFFPTLCLSAETSSEVRDSVSGHHQLRDQVTADPRLGIYFFEYDDVCWPHATGRSTERSHCWKFGSAQLEPYRGIDYVNEVIGWWRLESARTHSSLIQASGRKLAVSKAPIENYQIYGYKPVTERQYPLTLVVLGRAKTQGVSVDFDAEARNLLSCSQKLGPSWKVASKQTIVQLARSLAGEKIRFPLFDAEGDILSITDQAASFVFLWVDWEKEYYLADQPLYEKLLSAVDRKVYSSPSPSLLSRYTLSTPARLAKFGLAASPVAFEQLAVSEGGKEGLDFKFALKRGSKDFELIRDRIGLSVVCSGSAREVFPDEDIDGDGIRNAVDRCNRLGILGSKIHQAGEFVGCEAGQIPDTQN